MDEKKAGRKEILDELWEWLDAMPETDDFQALGEKLSELEHPELSVRLASAPTPKKYA